MPGRIRHSIAYWCLNATDWKWDVERICRTAKQLGTESVELVPPAEWPVLRKHGLRSALAPNGMPDPPFFKGVNNPLYHDEVIARSKRAIEESAAAGIPNIIAFTGMKWRRAEDPASGEIGLEEGAANSVKALKEIASHASRHNVAVCLEQLNTRDASHPMKGHPGYQGDDINYCADIVRRTGSPHVKLLFDIYHVQIMNGDVIRHLRAHRDILGHVHTAGVPGRGELDGPHQEVNYGAVMRTLLDIGYTGAVGHEFIPTRDPAQGLKRAIAICSI